MWEYEPYNVLTHHGILGMKHKIRMGPPYPLPANAHSAAEKKAGWRKSLDGNSKMETAGVRVNKKLKKLQEEDKKKQADEKEEETKLEKESEQELVKETEKKAKKESKKTKKDNSNNNTLESEKEKKSKKSDDSNNTLESVPDSEKSTITKTPSTSSGRSGKSSGSGSEPVVSGRNTKVDSETNPVEMEDMNGNKVGKSSSITKTNAVDGSEKEEISKESESNQNESGETKRKIVRVNSSVQKSSEISKQSDNSVKRIIKRKKR